MIFDTLMGICFFGGVVVVLCLPWMVGGGENH